METTRYTQINIGSDFEGYGSLHISDEFLTASIDALISSVRGEIPEVEIHRGVGVWEGVAEQSAHISVIADVDLHALRIRLRALKEEFNQDAIALIVGSELV